MAITSNVLTSGASDVDATSYATSSVSPGANRLVTLWVTSEHATTPNAPTVTGASMTWTQHVTIPFASNATPTRRLTVFRALSGSPGSGALTIDFGGVTMIGCMWVVAEFDGVDTGGSNGANAIVQSATNFSDSAVTGLTTTLSAFGSANNATAGGVFKNSASTISVGSGFTELAQTTQTTAALAMDTEFRADNDTTVDFTWSTGNAKCGGVALELKASAVSPPAVDFSLVHLTNKPFIRLFVESSSEFVNTSVNAGPAAQRTKIANYWVAIHSEDGATFTQGNTTKATSGDLTMAARMSALGPWMSEYRNGSYVQQKTQEAPLMEATPQTARAILTYWPGQYGGPRDSASTTRHTLAGAMTSSQNSMAVFTVVGGSNNAPNATADNSLNPPYTPNSWPYWETKSTAATSSNTAVCVSWVRVDNEIIRVETVNYDGASGITTLGVTRGVFGTAAGTHSLNAKVYSPVYIGSVTSGPDAALAGLPAVNLASTPLRYAIKIWHPDGYGFLGDRIEATFLKNDATNPWQGYNAIHYDVSGANRYNHSDAWAHGVDGWYDVTNQVIDNTIWGNAQKTKFQGHRARAGWSGMKLLANGAGQNWTTWKAVGLDAVVDAGYSEQFFPTTASISDSDVQFTFDAFANNYKNFFWLRPNRQPAEPDVAAHRRYTYGLILLAYRTTADRYAYGGGGFQNIYNAATNTAIAPYDLFMWNFGVPTTASPADINDANLDTGTANLKKRDFGNGLVLVNFTTGALNYNLGANNYYDINILDGSGNPTLVTGTIAVQSKDARFLLKEAAVTTGGAQNLNGTGNAIISAEAFGAGTVTLVGTNNLTGTGIASAQAMGVGTVTNAPTQALIGAGIASEQAFGPGIISVGGGSEGGDPLVFAGAVTPSRPRLPRVRHVFSSPDGQDVPIVNDWWAEEVAPGGFDVAGGQIDADSVRSQPGIYTAGATWQMWTQDGYLLWEGILNDPTVSRQTAELSGRGLKHLAEREAGRLVYVSRDYQDWVEQGSDPHGYVDVGSALSSRIGNGRLAFAIETGESVNTNDQAGLCFWAEGNRLNSVAGTVRNPLGGGTVNYELQVMSAVGPHGTRTQEGSALTITDGTAFSRTLNNDPDLDIALIRYIRTGTNGTVASPVRLWITDLRVLGASTADNMSSADVVRDVCSRLGVSDVGVEDTGDDLMPLDHKSGPFADILDYASTYSGSIWRFVSDGQGPYCEFSDGQRWFSSRLDGPTDLLPLSRFNRVNVDWTSGVNRRSFTATAEPSDIGVVDPYQTTNFRSAYNLRIDQRIHNDDLATQIAQRLLAIVVKSRFGGTIQRGFLVDSDGTERAAYELRAGDKLTIIDALPEGDATARVAKKRSTATGVELTFEDRVAEVDSYLARLDHKRPGLGIG